MCTLRTSLGCGLLAGATYSGDGSSCGTCTTGSCCFADGTCAADVQCPIGQICDAAASKCAPGCRGSGDCPQTSVDAQGVTVFSPQGCVNGQCSAAKCTSTAGCGLRSPTSEEKVRLSR